VLDPLKIPGGEDVVDLSVGFHVICMLKKDRSVWCVGNGGYQGSGEEFAPRDTAVQVDFSKTETR
jgi:hypothetical protein